MEDFRDLFDCDGDHCTDEDLYNRKLANGKSITKTAFSISTTGSSKDTSAKPGEPPNAPLTRYRTIQKQPTSQRHRSQKYIAAKGRMRRKQRLNQVYNLDSLLVSPLMSPLTQDRSQLRQTKVGNLRRRKKAGIEGHSTPANVAGDTLKPAESSQEHKYYTFPDQDDEKADHHDRATSTK